MKKKKNVVKMIYIVSCLFNMANYIIYARYMPTDLFSEIATTLKEFALCCVYFPPIDIALESQIITFSYLSVEKVLFWGQIFKVEILMDLHVLRSP